MGQDARRVMAVLGKRLGRFGLTLHPDKTRLLPFRRPPAEQRSGKGSATFDFLGFTLYCARSRRGRWGMACKTRRASLRRAIQSVTDGCRRQRHANSGPWWLIPWGFDRRGLTGPPETPLLPAIRSAVGHAGIEPRRFMVLSTRSVPFAGSKSTRSAARTSEGRRASRAQATNAPRRSQAIACSTRSCVSRSITWTSTSGTWPR